MARMLTDPDLLVLLVLSVIFAVGFGALFGIVLHVL
jgi:hypothetical protein